MKTQTEARDRLSLLRCAIIAQQELNIIHWGHSFDNIDNDVLQHAPDDVLKAIIAESVKAAKECEGTGR